MTDKSFINFLTDSIIRSFETQDWISEEVAKLDPAISRNLSSMNNTQQEAVRSVFNAMIETLKRNVRISLNQQTYDPQLINYHRRMGWIIQSITSHCTPNEAKIYLGKVSLLENTKITMGKRSYFSGPSVIRGGGLLTIGQYCSLAEKLYITTFNDNHPINHPAMMNFAQNRRLVEDGLNLDITYPELSTKSNTVSIGNDVWIGRNARITTGVNIADGCIIAEDSLIRNDCAPYGIYGGTPAKLIRYRFSEPVIEQLLKLKWWNWNTERIKSNKTFFATDLSKFQGNLSKLLS